MIKNKDLIPQLLAQTQEITQKVNQLFENRLDSQLRNRPANSNWNALDCVDHLNRTYDWYLPQIDKSLSEAKPVQNDSLSYQPGYMGTKMTEGSQPTQGKIRFKMKTFKKFEPNTDHLEAEEVLNTFRRNQDQFCVFIKKAERLNLGKIRVTSAIGPILRFKLGDCFRFLLAHNERHLLQCNRILNNE